MSQTAGRVADATGNWVDTVAPGWMRPYLRMTRLDRPIGWWLLLLPCWWSVALAAIPLGAWGPNLWHLFLMLVGAIVMRGAGCTWNDLVDRDIDGRVERTRSRPIPSGQISVKAAVVFLVAQALVGLVVLLQFNTFAIGTGIASLGVVAIYPFMKRITYWPQIFLGLAFSWGALMGWAAYFGRLDAPVELYDLANDIGEAKNLAAEQPDTIAKAKALFSSSRTEDEDPIAGCIGSNERAKRSLVPLFHPSHPPNREAATQTTTTTIIEYSFTPAARIMPGQP